MADHAIALSARGRKQAEAAAGHVNGLLKSDSVTALWSSPYRRARETAGLIAAGVAGQIHHRMESVLLCEQQFGLFSGVPDAELPTLFPAEYAHYQKYSQFAGRFWARPPLGESRFDVALRVHQCFAGLIRHATDNNVDQLVVVSHGVTVRAFVMMWCHLSPEWFEAESNPRNCAIRLIEDGEDRGYPFDGFED